jgi:indolepyruvate ferredoxin oxidoreductase beta subunit
MAGSKERTINIMIVGVGGQGVILASEILSIVAMKSGYDVKKSEIHGMAQRGGIVSSHVRYGHKVFSPLIPPGEADILLSFEEAEAIRWMRFLKSSGRAVVNLQEIIPPIVSIGMGSYPEDVKDILRKNTKDPVLIDALSIAMELGNPRMVNIVLLGVVSRMLDLPVKQWRRVIGEQVPPLSKDLNLKAFEKGRNAIK